MSRFPMLPLLLSFSTTLQSACLQDKCALPEFENNPECKTDMGPIRSYVYERNGAEVTVDSIGMIDVNKFVNNAEYIAEIALLIKYKDNSKDKLELILGNFQKMCGDSCVLSAKPLLTGDGDVSQHGLMAVSNLGVRFVIGSSFHSYNWGSSSVLPSITKNDGLKYYSLSADTADRIHAVINNNSKDSPLLIYSSSLFNGTNLNKEVITNGMINFKVPRLALVGNFRLQSPWSAPEIILWDDFGGSIGTLSTYGRNFDEYYLDRDARSAVMNYNNTIPDLCKAKLKDCEMRRVAIGDLDGNGLSDLIVAESDVEKKTFTIAVYYNKFGTFFRRNLFETNNIPLTPVQAIAVSIPNGDDPPKLVWATSSYDSGKTANKITINVLPIMK